MIKFAETDSDNIISDLIASFEAYSGRTLAPADPYRLLINWAANLLVQERALINKVGNNNLLSFATGEYLDAVAELFRDTNRLQASPAKTIMRFKLSKIVDEDYIIPTGIRVSVNEVLFATKEPLVFTAGTDTTDITVVCLIPGTIGNDYIPGQINTLVDVFTYYDNCENITTSSGGTDTESDDELRTRAKLSADAYSVAGPVGAYEYIVKSVSTDIIDVKVTSPEVGVVDIRVLRKDGELPTETLINDIETAVSAGKTRPLTDKVNVLAPEAVTYDIDIIYYISDEDLGRAAEIDNAVSATVDNYVQWQKSKIGRDINDSELIAKVRNAGAKRVIVNSPLYTVVADKSVAIAKTINITNGGVEND